jgi:hypothetical protein
MLMATELPRRPSRGIRFEIFEWLKNPDVVAVCAFAFSGLLITIVLARIFPLEKAIDLLLLAD